LYSYSHSYRSDWSEHDMLEGMTAPVTCAACGCRLTLDTADPQAGRWLHFHPFAGRDARGCAVSCVDLAHDRTGHALTA
jgi:hypothetical protein